MSLDSAFKAFVGSVAGKHFAEPEQFLTATVTEYAPPGIGTGAQVTVSVGGNDGVILPYTLQDRIGVGDRLKVRTGRDQINRTYEVVSKDFTTDVAGQYIPGHRSPVVLVDGLANLPGASTPGGYHAAASVRYQSVRRGQYDLFGQGWNRMRVRYRQTDPTFFIIDGPNVTSWIDPGSFLPHPSATILTTLLAGITALSTSLLLAANLDIPPNPTGADGGSVRLLVDNEIVSGDYTAATGVVSNLSRGVEPLPGDTTTNANSHSIGAPVTLLTAAIDIPTLATGTSYYVQIAPAREDGTIGIYVPSVPIAFTSWEQAQPPTDVAGLLMNQTRAALDARWHRVLVDILGNPVHDLKGFNVIRSVDPSTSVGWDATAKTTPSDQLPASWTNLVDGPIDATSVVAANQVLWPIARGTGNWIGVRAMRNAGPVSPHWVWTLDNTPPPRPDPAYVTLGWGTNAMRVAIDPLDTAHTDAGWMTYELWSATNTSGAGATYRGRFSDDTDDLPYFAGSSVLFYQVISVDWAGNKNALLNLGDVGYANNWKQLAQVPAPNRVSWSVVPLDTAIGIFYDPSADTAHPSLDPGFARFDVYRATNTSGASAVNIGSLLNGSLAYMPPLDQIYFYQLVSVDLADGHSALVNTDQYWKPGISNLFSSGIINGAFQVPGAAARVVTDAVATNGSVVITSATANFTADDIGQIIRIVGAGDSGVDFYGSIVSINSSTSVNVPNVTNKPTTSVNPATAYIGGMPYGWGFNNVPDIPEDLTRAVRKIEYLTTGGTSGNRVLRVTIKAGTYTLNQCTFSIFQRYAQNFNTNKTQGQIEVWAKTAAPGIQVSASAWVYDDDFGKVNVQQAGGLGTTTPTPDGSWHAYQSSIVGAYGATVMFDGTRHSYRIGINFEIHGTLATDTTVDIDDISFVIS